MFRRSGLMLVALAGVVVALIAAAAPAAGTQTAAVVKVGPSNLGRVLVDAKGKTLYMWARDKGGKSSCYEGCAEFWPPLLTKGKPVAGAGAVARFVGTTVRSDGRLQVTYKGRPLYRFVQDVKAGQTKGAGLTGGGGRWDPVSAAGSPVRRSSGACYAGDKDCYEIGG